MIDLIFISLIYIIPIGGISFVLFRLGYKYFGTWKHEFNDKSVKKKAQAKMVFSLLGGAFCAISSTFWLVVLWIPGIAFPELFYTVLFAPIVIIGLCAPLLFGLGKTVEAGAPSVTKTLFKLTGKDSKHDEQQIAANGMFERRSEAEILIIRKRLKKSSYSPTMPIGVFILSFVAIYGILGDKPNSLIQITLVSFLAFDLTYLLQIIRGRSFVGSPGVKICDKCHNTDSIGLKQCSCGGIYEPVDFYIYKEGADKV